MKILNVSGPHGHYSLASMAISLVVSGGLYWSCEPLRFEPTVAPLDVAAIVSTMLCLGNVVFAAHGGGSVVLFSAYGFMTGIMWYWGHHFVGDGKSSADWFTVATIYATWSGSLGYILRELHERAQRSPPTESIDARGAPSHAQLSASQFGMSDMLAIMFCVSLGLMIGKEFGSVQMDELPRWWAFYHYINALPSGVALLAPLQLLRTRYATANFPNDLGHWLLCIAGGPAVLNLIHSLLSRFWISFSTRSTDPWMVIGNLLYAFAVIAISGSCARLPHLTRSERLLFIAMCGTRILNCLAYVWLFCGYDTIRLARHIPITLVSWIETLVGLTLLGFAWQHRRHAWLDQLGIWLTLVSWAIIDWMFPLLNWLMP